MKTLDLVDIDILDKNEYFSDDRLYHLTNGYKFIYLFAKDDSFKEVTEWVYDIVRYVCTASQPGSCSHLPTYQRALVSIYISELHRLIEKMQNLASENKNTEIYVCSLESGKVSMDKIIRCYTFEIEVLKEALDSNFKDFELKHGIARTVDEETGELMEIDLPFPSSSDMLQAVIDDEKRQCGNDDECDKPLDEILLYEMWRRGLLDDTPIPWLEEYTVKDYRDLVISKANYKLPVLEKDKALVTDKMHAAVLYHMLIDALRDNDELLVKVISYVNGKEYDEKHKSSFSAYNYVHDPSKLEGQLKYVVKELKRYKLEGLLKNHLNEAKQRQFGLQ